jgi:hypothetical protein
MNDKGEQARLMRIPDSSIYSSDVEEGVAKTSKHLNTHYPVPVIDLIERENENPAIGPGSTPNLIHDIDPQIDDGDLDSDDDDDELCRSPSWYEQRRVCSGPAQAGSASAQLPAPTDLVGDAHKSILSLRAAQLELPSRIESKCH